MAVSCLLPSNCCNLLMHASRNHVLSDLRPYICTIEDCHQANEHFASTRELLRHELSSHEPQYAAMFHEMNESGQKGIKCLFCSQHMSGGTGKTSRERHISQHMEEIAFTAVPQTYEDWEFYSEASSVELNPKDPYTGDPYAGIRFTNLSKAVHSSLDSTKPEVYNCVYCKESYYRPEHLMIHAQTHGSPFSCPDCGRRFCSRDGFFFHRSYSHRTSDARFLCTHLDMDTGKFCGGGVFSRVRDLILHRDLAHLMKLELFQCQHCKEMMTYPGKAALHRHVRTFHPNVRTLGRKQGTSAETSRSISPTAEASAEATFKCFIAGRNLDVT